MSNTITAFFKGRVGVAEAVYQNDYGIVMNLDSIELPAHFDCYFSTLGDDEAIPGIGADNQVVIPNGCLSRPGSVTLHIPLHAGANDSEVEYIVYFKVIGRARPIDDGTPVQMTAIEQALALLQNPIGNIEQIVNEALAFTGDTFAEMQEQLDADQAAFKTEIRGNIADVESDFDNLNAQFQTAISAVTVDDELLNVRVGDDGVTYTSAGEAVRTQFSDLKNALDMVGEEVVLSDNFLPPEFENGFISSTGALTNTANSCRSRKYVPVIGGSKIILMNQTDLTSIRVATYNSSHTFIERLTLYCNAPLQLSNSVAFIKVATDVFDATTALTKKIGVAYSETTIEYEPYESHYKIGDDVLMPQRVDEKFDELSEDIASVIIRTSINLIPPVYEDGFITSTGSETSPANSCRSKDYIPANGGANVIMMESSNALSSINVATYNSSKAFISRLTVNANTPVQLPSDTAFIRFATSAVDATTALTKEIGLAYSDSPIYYSPYDLKKYLGDEVLIDGLHKHNHMKWCAMGDSITEGTYSDSNGAHVVPSETWVSKVAELCQYDATNKGIGGTGWVKKGSLGDKKNAREQVADIDFSDYDLVTLSFGVNDWKGGVSWGSMSDSPSLGGTVYSNMKYVIEKIIDDNPYAKVIVITPFNCRQGKAELATEATNYAIGYDYDGHTLQDMFDLEKEVCEYYGIQYIDMTHTSIINRVNAVHATPDAVHPSLDAHRCIAYQTANSLMYNN